MRFTKQILTFAQIFEQPMSEKEEKSEVKISVQLPVAANDAYKRIAKEQKTSKNAVIVNVLTDYLLKKSKP